jgi:hypothetical protein
MFEQVSEEVGGAYELAGAVFEQVVEEVVFGE